MICWLSSKRKLQKKIVQLHEERELLRSVHQLRELDQMRLDYEQRERNRAMTPDQLASSGTEDGHQRAVFAYANDRRLGKYGMTPANPLWALLYAIPNGGQRSGKSGAMMKSTGTKPGFPDMGLPVARGGWFGLFIELKKETGTVQDNQKPWHIELREQGYLVKVCYGWLQAVQAIDNYLAGQQTLGSVVDASHWTT